MKRSGNAVVITGGTSGIGRALAEALVAAGNEVLVCGRRAERLTEVQSHHPAIHTFRCDLATGDGRRSLLACVRERFPRANVLVNNAGIQRDVDLTRGDADLLGGESEIAINLEAPIHLAALFIPLLAGKPGACIVNVSSGLGFVPLAGMPVYCATKAALHSFSLSLRAQVAPLGIDVQEVVPPAVDTELNPSGRAARPGTARGMTEVGAFAAAIVEDLVAGQREIGYGYTKGMLKASRGELDERFAAMNGLAAR